MLGKTELVNRIAQKSGMSSSKANQLMTMVFDTISEALQRGEEVRLTGFGTFRVMETKERTAFNPRTREPIRVAASKRVAFSPGAGLTSAVRGQGGRRAA